MRFATGWVKAAEHRRTPKALGGKSKHASYVSRSFGSATRPRVAFVFGNCDLELGIWDWHDKLVEDQST
jgi:hypothetical protein